MKNRPDAAAYSPSLSEADAAHLLTLRPSTLRAWRVRGLGPCYSHAGRRVVYLAEDLRAFLLANRVEPKSRRKGGRG
jgi:Helix-turn-helix domain